MFNKGSKLKIRAHHSEWGCGLRYSSFEAVALEDGFTGGWDVWDVRKGNEEVSVYGFSIEVMGVQG